jgi:HD-GYP domain-containing protein (c-di-GMP phosphodiesterase class II)
VATRAGLAAADCERARLCGLVHDIGKIGVPEAVLRKPGKLTDAEFATIAEHPVTGHDILRGIPQMADVLPGVLHHHERFDGRGYPHRLAGEQIPMIGRVIAVADAIDAMTTSRTYRSARPMAAAVEEVVRSAGSHFDPMLARAVGSMDLRELQAIVGLHVFGPGLPGGATLDAAWAAARMVAIPAGADQPGAMRRTA